MIKKSAFLRIFSGYLIITLFLFSLTLLFSFPTIKKHYIKTLSVQLEKIGYLAIENFTSYLEAGDLDEMRTKINRLGERINVRITVIDREGVVIADSKKESGLMENHKNRPEIVSAFLGSIGQSLRYSATLKKEMLYIALPLYIQNEIVYVTRISVFFDEVNLLLNELLIRIILLTVLASFISLTGAFIYTRNITEPIKDLVNAAKEIAVGNFDIKIFIDRKGDFKTLADSFNAMTEEIKHLFGELTVEKEWLSMIMSSIQESLWVIDEKNKLVFANDSFKKIVNTNSIEDKYYWELIQNTNLNEYIKKIRKEKNAVVDELMFKDAIYLFSGQILASKQIIIILYNITEIKKAEEFKKNIIDNVSHELKTPLTSIKGFVETLKNEEIDKNKLRYLNIIERNANRLSNIVNDLTVLSQLQKRENDIIYEKARINKLIDDIYCIFEKSLQDKKLKFILNADPEIIIEGDNYLLEKMFINLIDNAVKYTENGEIIITIIQIKENIKIIIEDTGIGIPEQHRDKIFGRFYVVNKSRSRKLGGTGLGLSIVKRVVELHNGTIKVEARENKGTRFIVTLPMFINSI